jgi:hypothetical protein
MATAPTVRPSGEGLAARFEDLFLLLFGIGGFFMLLSILPEKLTDLCKSLSGLEKRDTLRALVGWTGYDVAIDPSKADDTRILILYRQLHRAAGENNSVWLRSPSDPPLTEGLKSDPANLPAPGSPEMAQVRSDLITLDVRLSDLESARVARLRILSVLFGILVVLGFDDSLALILRSINAQLGDTLKGAGGLSWTGILLLGSGAGLGASFWQDFLDVMTKTRERLAGALKAPKP